MADKLLKNGRNDFQASADVYDVIYRDKDYAAEMRWIVGLIAELGITTGRWLDVGCGTGRHLAELPSGYEAQGADRSQAMLRKAGARLPAVPFVEAPATALPIDPPFDVISAIFAVVSYLAEPGELDAFLAEAARLLRPGGALYFDVWHGGAVLKHGPEQRWQRYPTEDGEVIRFSRPEHDPLLSRVVVHYDYLRVRADQIVLRSCEAHCVRYYFPLEIREACARHNLHVVRLAPFLESGRSVQADDWSLAVVARRG